MCSSLCFPLSAFGGGWDFGEKSLSSSTFEGQWQCLPFPQVLGSSEQGALDGSGAGVHTLVLGCLTVRGHFGNKASSKMVCAEVKMVLLGAHINRQPFPLGAFPR